MTAGSAKGGGGATGAAEELLLEADPLRRLAGASALLAELRARQLQVTQLRDAAVIELRELGLSYAEIARVAGTTRGRVAQIVRRQDLT